MKAFSDKYTPGRFEHIKQPSAAEMKSTSVVRMPIVEASAKIRKGPPGDDAEDYNNPRWRAHGARASRMRHILSQRGRWLRLLEVSCIVGVDPAVCVPLARYWAGVIPLRMFSLPAVPDERLLAGVATPRHVSDFAFVPQLPCPRPRFVSPLHGGPKPPRRLMPVHLWPTVCGIAGPGWPRLRLTSSLRCWQWRCTTLLCEGNCSVACQAFIRVTDAPVVLVPQPLQLTQTLRLS